MNGRSAAGHSSTTSTHHPALTTSAPAASARSRSRRPHPTGAATSHTSVSAGSTRNACSILVRNPNPTRVAASSSQRVPPRSTARNVAYPAATSSSVSRASGLLNRKINTAAGVSASAAPPNNAAPVASRGASPAVSAVRRTDA